MRTPGDILSRLDAEMYRILNSPTLGGAREKWKLYREVLQRYLYYFRQKEKEKEKRRRRLWREDTGENNPNDDDDDEDTDGGGGGGGEKTRSSDRTPASGAIAGDDDDVDMGTERAEAVTEDIPILDAQTFPPPREVVADERTFRPSRTHERRSIAKILDNVPKSYRAKARKMLTRLCNVAVPARIRWNRQGVVTIDEELLRGSNILDLVNDLARERKTTGAAVGRSQFVRVLRDVGVPTTFIGNRKLRDAANRSSSSFAEEEAFAKLRKTHPRSSSTPVPLPERQLRRKRPAAADDDDDDRDEEEAADRRELLVVGDGRGNKTLAYSIGSKSGHKKSLLDWKPTTTQRRRRRRLRRRDGNVAESLALEEEEGKEKEGGDLRGRKRTSLRKNKTRENKTAEQPSSNKRRDDQLGAVALATMTELVKLYYDPAHYAGYSATGNLSRAAKPNFARDAVVRWLESQDAYTLHRPLRRKFPRLHYNVTNIDDLWEVDLIELRAFKSYNDGYAYLLTIIDVLGKFVWVEPIRDKSSVAVADALRRVFSRSGGRRPVCLQSDRGKEFLGQPFQKLLTEKNIRFRAARNPDVKAAVVERFNRTLKERMWRYFTHKNTRRYVDVLQNIVSAYNHTPHSTTRMQPASVTLENARLARENTARRYRRLDRKRGNRNRPAKYSAGDLVRISRAKGTFEKGYEGNWTEEIFRVHRVLEWRHPRVYELRDQSDEVIDGIFYEQELTRVDKNLQEEEFIVDKVIRSRGRGKAKELLVKWRGYPDKFNSWIPAANLKSLTSNHDARAISHDSTE